MLFFFRRTILTMHEMTTMTVRKVAAATAARISKSFLASPPHITFTAEDS